MYFLVTGILFSMARLALLFSVHVIGYSKSVFAGLIPTRDMDVCQRISLLCYVHEGLAMATSFI
jgi:hypothetical protein